MVSFTSTSSRLARAKALDAQGKSLDEEIAHKRNALLGSPGERSSLADPNSTQIRVRKSINALNAATERMSKLLLVSMLLASLACTCTTISVAQVSVQCMELLKVPTCASRAGPVRKKTHKIGNVALRAVPPQSCGRHDYQERKFSHYSTRQRAAGFVLAGEALIEERVSV